jgi:hypothetical protein
MTTTTKISTIGILFYYVEQDFFKPVIITILKLVLTNIIIFQDVCNIQQSHSTI